MFGLSFLHFLGQIVDPAPAGMHSQGVPSGAVPPFVIQSGDQDLTLASTQTFSSMG